MMITSALCVLFTSILAVALPPEAAQAPTTPAASSVIEQLNSQQLVAGADLLEEEEGFDEIDLFDQDEDEAE